MSIKATNWVWHSVRGIGELKLILAVIADIADDNGIAWPSYQNIADKTDLSLSTAKRHIKRLREMGLITVQRRTVGYNKTTNSYRLALDTAFDFRERSSVNLTPASEANLTPVSSVNLTPASSVSSVTRDPSVVSPGDLLTTKNQEEEYSSEDSPRARTTPAGGPEHPVFTRGQGGQVLQIRKFGMTPDWQPDDGTLDRIRHRGIDTAFAKGQLDTFRMHYAGLAPAHAGGWQAKFFAWVVRNWESGGRERHQAAAGAGQDVIDRIGDRSWADGVLA